MKLHKWKDIKHKGMSPERVARLDREVEQEILEMQLRELREAAGMTQEQMAQALGTAQPEISALERRDDYRLSTLAKYVKALGGKLEIIASFGNRRVRLGAS